MKITRTFIFEGDEERIARQLKFSCPDGEFDLGFGVNREIGLVMTVVTEGASAKIRKVLGKDWNGPTPLPYAGGEPRVAPEPAVDTSKQKMDSLIKQGMEIIRKARESKNG